MATDAHELRGRDARDPTGDWAQETPARDDGQDSGPGGVPEAGMRGQAMQRMQIGLAGLAAMVLLVGLASIIMTSAQQNQADVVPEAASTVSVREPVEPVSDPLADMGVVPGEADGAKQKARAAEAVVPLDAPTPAS